MSSYVRQRLAEIGADPALRRALDKDPSRDKRSLAAELLSGLGFSIRLLIVVHLLDNERTVADLLSQIGCSPSTLSQHISKLLELDIVESRVDRGRRYYSCKSREAKRVVRFVDRLAATEMIPSGTDDHSPACV
ncbi:ArsR/SmtB family transcription factor [Mesorhizobium sp. ORM8.1]